MKKLRYLFFLVLVIMAFPQDCYPKMMSAVSGQVVDETTGKGIEGVSVEILRTFSSPIGKGITNKNGEFTITNIPVGSYGIEFKPPEPYAWDKKDLLKLQKLVPVSEGIQIISVEKNKTTFVYKKCKIGGVLNIRIFEKNTNMPIEMGVRASLFRCMNKGLFYTVEKTNSQGLFHLSGIPEGKVDLTLEKAGIWPIHLRDLEISYNKTTSIDVPLDLASPNQIIGRVVCKATCEPIKEVRILIHSLDKPVDERCYTDINGCFSMLSMEPGRYRLLIIGYDKNVHGSNDYGFEAETILTGKNSTTVDFQIDCNLFYRRSSGDIE